MKLHNFTSLYYQHLVSSAVASLLQWITQFLPAVEHNKTMPDSALQLQGVIARWLVVISHTHGGMARLSRPGWNIPRQISRIPS